MHGPCYCYIVECADGTYYTGWTVNPEKRVAVHNKGRGARYTRTRGPVKLVYVEELPDRKSAMKREVTIKKLPRGKKMKLMESGGLYEVRSPAKRDGAKSKMARQATGTHEK